MNRHPTALVDEAAEIASDVEIGPYAIVEGAATIAAGVRVEAHAQIIGDVRIGERSVIGRGAVLGGDPQSIGFDPTTKSGVTIGCDNVLREHVTIHRGLKNGSRTVLGNQNFLMAGAHLGHDVIAGNNNVIANNCLLGGHIEMGNRCFLGGGSVFHQFVRIGDLVMVRGNGASSKDIPPYTILAETNRIAGMNVVGLRRAGFSAEARKAIKDVYKLVYRSGLNLSQALEKAASDARPPEAQMLVDFLSQKTDRGYCLQLLD